MSETSFVLTLASDPLPGIIAAVTTALADLGGNITETHQHWDRPTNRFFLRVAFLGPDTLTVPAVEQALAPTVERFGLDLKVTDAARPPRIIAMVSKFDHALLHLLYQIRVGWLHAEVAAIVSNHEDSPPDRRARRPPLRPPAGDARDQAGAGGARCSPSSRRPAPRP